MSDEFVFPDMTPGLQAYFDYCDGTDVLVNKTYPPYLAAKKIWEEAGKPEGPLKEERDRLYNTHYDGLKEYKDQGEQMRLALGGLIEKYYNAKKKWYCRDATAVGDPIVEICGQYKLKITKHKTGSKTWEYSRGEVYFNDKLITTVYRNYGSFPFAFVPSHPNGHAYLICGENYQGQTVVELDTGNRVDYMPKAASQGFGFCWVRAFPSPSGINLAAEGCYWACPYEVIIVDFSEPMNPPWPELCRDSANDSFDGWIDDYKCKIGRGYEFCATLNKPCNDMSMEELEQIEKLAEEKGVSEDSMYEWKVDSIVWTKPSALEIAKDYINDTFAWRRDLKIVPVPVDFIMIANKLIEKLSKEDCDKLKLDTELYNLYEWSKGNSE